jgi:hypothetical protein
LVVDSFLQLDLLHRVSLVVESFLPFNLQIWLSIHFCPTGSNNNMADDADNAGDFQPAEDGIPVTPAVMMESDEEPFAPTHADDDEEDDTTEPYSDFEIFGLSSNTSGRTCNHHECCGAQVQPGDILRLKKTLVEVDTGVEEAVACILVRLGRETCTVAYVPRALLYWPPISAHLNRHVQVVEMYVLSRNSQKRRKNHLCCGVAGCVFIDQIDQDE